MYNNKFVCNEKDYSNLNVGWASSCVWLCQKLTEMFRCAKLKNRKHRKKKQKSMRTKKSFLNENIAFFSFFRPTKKLGFYFTTKFCCHLISSKKLFLVVFLVLSLKNPHSNILILAQFTRHKKEKLWFI